MTDQKHPDRPGRAPRVPPKAVLRVLKKYDPLGDFAVVVKAAGVTQQDFLLAAMARCGLGRQDMALRLGCGKKTLDKWLSPEGTQDFRAMSPLAWKFVAEILIHEERHELAQISR